MMLLNKSAVFALVVFTPQGIIADVANAEEPFDEAWFCELVSDMAKEQNAAIRQGDGVWADAGTENLGTFVSCQMKVVNWSKRLHLNPTDMRDGWRGRKQHQWSARYCGEETWIWRDAIRTGWTISSTVTLLDGSQYRFDADCG